MVNRDVQKPTYNKSLIRNSLKVFDNFAYASSIDEANQFAKENISNIKNIDYSWFDLKIANDYNKHILLLQNLFPQIKCNYLGIGRDDFFRNLELKKLYELEFDTKNSHDTTFDSNLKKSLEESMKSINKKYSDDYIGKVMDQSHGKYEGIWINITYAESYVSLMREVKTLITHKQAPNIEPCIEYILTHEFGHLIVDSLIKDWYEKSFIDELWSYLNRKYYVNLRDYLKENLSFYACKNKSEFFCEAFAEFIHSKKPRPLAKIVGDELKHELKFRDKVLQI